MSKETRKIDREMESEELRKPGEPERFEDDIILEGQKNINVINGYACREVTYTSGPFLVISCEFFLAERKRNCWA